MVINIISMNSEAFSNLEFAMVRKGGFEPPRLSAPPPQDGVSASSTTSAISTTATNFQHGSFQRWRNEECCSQCYRARRWTATISRAIAGFGRCRQNCGLFYIVRTLLLVPLEKSGPGVWQLHPAAWA